MLRWYKVLKIYPLLILKQYWILVQQEQEVGLRKKVRGGN